MENQANINHLINLKAAIIVSLKGQGMPSNFTYPTLRNLNIHQIHFAKQLTN